MSKKQFQRNGLEWAVFGLGALLVGALVVYLGYDVLAGPDVPAAIQVTLGPPTAQADGARVLVVVENRGGRAAEDVQVEVCAAREACAGLTFPLVPAGARREGQIGLDTTGAWQAHVVSYREP